MVGLGVIFIAYLLDELSLEVEAGLNQFLYISCLPIDLTP